MEWQTVNRNHGVQDQLVQSMTAMQNSISQLAQSICTRPPPGSKAQGKGKSSKGQGKGAKSSPGERKSPNLKPEEERAEPTTEEVKCPKCPNTYNWTTRVVCRSCGCKLLQGNVTKTRPSQKSPGPASAKTGGGGSSSGASSGTSYASVVKGEAGPTEASKEEKGTKGHPAKESRIDREVVGCHGQRRPSQRGPRKSARTAPSCIERPSQPGSETRFSHGENAQSQSQGAEMRRTTPPGGSIFAVCPCRRRRGQLRAESSTGKCCPKTARTPPGGCSYAIVLRGHQRSDRYVKAVRPSGHGGRRRRLRGAGQKGPNRPLQLPTQNSPGDCEIGEPSFGGTLGEQRQHFAGRGEEWWGWIIGRDTPWGSRGPPRALPPPTTKSRRPCATRVSPESARRTCRSQRNCERHGHTKPAQCADARLKLPRENTQSPANSHRHPQKRLEIFRKPSLLKIWLCLLLVLSSPGSKAGTDATSLLCTVSGDSPTGTRHCTAPGGDCDEYLRQAVPTLRCSEHAKQSMQRSSKDQAQRSSQRGRHTRHEQEGDVCPLWTAKVPGTHRSGTTCLSQIHMSDMKCAMMSGRTMPGMSPALASDMRCATGKTVPGMTHIIVFAAMLVTLQQLAG